MSEYRSPNPRVFCEVLQKKGELAPQLLLFDEVEF
jgi:hypothetical protein